MGTSRFSLTLLLICVILAVHAAAYASPAFDFGGDAFIPVSSECRGSIADCLVMEGDAVSDFDLEFAMGSESNRRILATTRYISYGALRRNSVPCSRRGASYYNCRPGAQANPYSRGCSRITRCRR